MNAVIRGMSALTLGAVLVGCGPPPTYHEVSREAVDLRGQACTAVKYSVSYTILDGPATTERLTAEEYAVVCGSTTHKCQLNQSLAACIAAILAPPRRDDDDRDNGYTPPAH